MNESTESLPMTVEHYFGGCPECGGNDGYMNVSSGTERAIGPVHVCVCDQHRTAWIIGVNLFSLDPDFDTPARMREQLEKLKSYRTVEPLKDGSRRPEPGQPA